MAASSSDADPLGIHGSPGLPRDDLARLRAGFDEGRSAHGDLGLELATYLSRALAVIERRLAAAGTAPDRARLAATLRTTFLADLHLAIACDLGREAAWEVLLQRFTAPLRAHLLRSGATGAQADEILRDLPGALCLPPAGGTARTRLGTYDGSGPLLAWLCVLVRRRFCDVLRAPRTLPLEDAAERPGAALAFVPAVAPDPADLVADRETRERVRVALAKAWRMLTAREALVLDLALRETLPQRRIAALLRVGEPRVSRLLHAASTKLEAAVVRALRAQGAGLALADARDLLSALLEEHRQSTATQSDLPAPVPEIRHERPSAT